MLLDCMAQKWKPNREKRDFSNETPRTEEEKATEMKRIIQHFKERGGFPVVSGGRRYAHASDDDGSNRYVHPPILSECRSPLVEHYGTENGVLCNIIDCGMDYSDGKIPLKAITEGYLLSEKQIREAMQSDPKALKRHGIEVIFED